jgi:hypothetical protein
MRHVYLLVLGTLVISSIGCGPDTGDKLPVSGTVTLKGQPIAHGTINFEAKSGGTFSGGLINEGKYSVPTESGLEPGTYIVRISAAEPGAPVTDPLPGESGPPLKELVPPEYNAQSQVEVEVKAGSENTFNFEIP